MSTDQQIQKDVVEELRWVPDIDESNIGVLVADGIVTLSGFVPDYRDRFQAECATKRVKGVRGIANEIRVSAHSASLHPDADLVRDCLAVIRADIPELEDVIKVSASNSHLTLDGTVGAQWQRERIESTVRAIEGVATVNNLIVVLPPPYAAATSAASQAKS